LTAGIETILKLIIQIPCFNEADTLPATISDLPDEVEGFSSVEYLVIDDGSTDGTSEVARDLGVHHILRFPRNRGLATAFAHGMQEALRLNADVIVNTDGDNQYSGESIVDLVAPILSDQADMVVGDRDVATVKHFSRFKVLLQRLGSAVVRWASDTDVPDATSGLRAFTRQAALEIVIYSSYTYTLETIIQAGKRGLKVVSVPVQTNERLRESRLIRSTSSYVLKSIGTIIRIFLMYEPLRVFLSLGSLPFIVGIIFIIRFGYFYAIGEGGGHIQSLIISSILIVVGFLTFLLGLLADLIARNRYINEEVVVRLRRMDLEG
jgi:glycosyltransferase involved in cell wall biosynthesis